MNSTLVIFLSIAQTLATGFLIFMLQRSINKRDERREKRDSVKEEYFTVVTKLVVATVSLTEANANAFKQGKPTGELEVALKYLMQIKHEHKDYLLKIGAEALL